jgi:Ser/Thr protein kinase RdoA (MazF antagonist)
MAYRFEVLSREHDRASFRSSREDLEVGSCHGDLHGWNAHIDQNMALTVYDFDCCGVGWRAYDIAVFRWIF